MFPGFNFLNAMKFSININQREARLVSEEIDLVDMAIFDFIKDFAQSPDCIKMQHNGTTYFMFSWKLISDQLPILGINTQRGIQKRLERLAIHDIIKSHPDIEHIRRPFYTFGSNYKRLLFSMNENSEERTSVHGSMNNRSPSPRTDVHGSMNERSPDKSISYKNTTEKNITKKTGVVKMSLDDCINLPLPFADPEFKIAWREWNEHRIEKAKPQTPGSIKQQLKFLGAHDLLTAIEIIETAIRGGWEGLHPIKQQYNGKQRTGGGAGSQAEFNSRIQEYKQLD